MGWDFCAHMTPCIEILGPLKVGVAWHVLAGWETSYHCLGHGEEAGGRMPLSTVPFIPFTAGSYHPTGRNGLFPGSPGSLGQHPA